MALLTYLCVSSISLAVQCWTPLKLRQYQRGEETSTEPTKSHGIPWTPRQNILGCFFICIGFELCLRSIVGLPGFRAHPYVPDCSAKGKERTTAIVLPARMVKAPLWRKLKLTVMMRRETGRCSRGFLSP